MNSSEMKRDIFNNFQMTFIYRARLNQGETGACSPTGANHISIIQHLTAAHNQSMALCEPEHD